MSFLAVNKFKDQVSEIIYEDTQFHETHIDLTVSSVYRINGAGSLDFGGSEFKASTIAKIEPEKRKAEDDYGWWKLKEGPYRIEFNEKLNLEENQTAIISPHPHSQEAGLVSNSNYLTNEMESGILKINVTVSEAGCNIKENARLAELRIYE